MEIKGYITNLGKYNEGYLVGKWIDFPIDDDEFDKVLAEIGINEEYEEFFFTDWECSAHINLGLGEYESVGDINNLCADIQEFIDSYGEDTLEAACEVWNLPEVVREYGDDYILLWGVSTTEELGRAMDEEEITYLLQASNLGYLVNHIDYESIGRDHEMSYDGGFCKNGYVYRV